MRADSGKTGCLLAAVALTALAALCVGVVSVSEGGSPPGGWPAELTPYLNGVVEYGIVTRISETHYVIPFEDRESFERAWPLLLTLKSPGGSLTLYRAGQPGTG
ncbi:hypothetical protein JW848_04520, partial [Candidatus Bipolaricaulota bacterium]|nr:hypothetical protein [Candidatus Bipolaricaulota bacterium]